MRAPPSSAPAAKPLMPVAAAAGSTSARANPATVEAVQQAATIVHNVTI